MKQLTALLLSLAMTVIGAGSLPLRAAQAPGPAPTVIAAYEGTLPCADCSGLRTELRLSAAAPDAEHGTYVITYTYVGAPRGDVTREEAGRWRIVRGTAADRPAVTYELTVDNGQAREYWVQASRDELRSRDMTERDGKTPVRLTRVSPPGAYRPAAVDDPGVVKAAAFAVSGQRTTNPDVALVRIVGAERQVVAGTNYRLCLSLTRSGRTEPARAVVFRDLKGALHTSSWTWGACGGR